LPGGKALKAFKGAAAKLGIKKLEKQLLKQAQQKAKQLKKAKKGKKVNTSKDQFKKKKSGLSGKEGAKNAPDWVKEEGYQPRVGESGKEFARRVMDEKYGPGTYNPREEPEFSQIKKWADRAFE